MNDDERLSYLKSSLQISHEEKVAKNLSISRKTVTKYLDENMPAINGNYCVRRKSILDPFLGDVNKLIDKR